MACGGDRGGRGERIWNQIDCDAAEDRAEHDHGDVGGGLASDDLLQPQLERRHVFNAFSHPSTLL